MGKLRNLVSKVFCLCLILHIHFATIAQVAVTASVDGGDFYGGETVCVVLSAETSFFYAAFAEVLFDDHILEFEGVIAAGICEGGIAHGGLLGPGSAGVAVSRTSAPTDPQAGSFMHILFTVKPGSPPAETEIHFTGIQIFNSDGDYLPAGEVLPVIAEIRKGEPLISLIMPGELIIEEGELFLLEGQVDGYGWEGTGIESMQYAISPIDTHPDEWGEMLWKEMEYEGEDDEGMLFFRTYAGYMLTPGEWFVAIRALKDTGTFIYGGIGGNWDQQGNPSGNFTINVRPPGRYPIAEWNFDNRTMLTSTAVAGNRSLEIALEGATQHGFSTGYQGYSANSRGWDGAGGFWMAGFSAEGFSSLEVSSRQYGSGTGPRDFRIDYSYDGENWLPVGGGEITVAGDWLTGVAERLVLPDETSGASILYLRWINISDISVGGGTTGSAGTNRIDNILVTGIPAESEYLTVFPGDTNNDGVVNADDVLPLGLWWLSGGPPRVWESIEFSGMLTEGWVPPAATFADANGDGIIDHRDLLPVGINFGRTATFQNKDTSVPVSVLHLDPTEDASPFPLMVTLPSEENIRGVAFSIRIDGIPADLWEVKNAVPLFANDLIRDEILRFDIKQGDTYEAAFVLKGEGDDVRSGMPVSFDLAVCESVQVPFKVMLERFTAINSVSQIYSVRTGGLLPAGEVTYSVIPGVLNDEGLRLVVYPNPLLRYGIAEFVTEGRVRVKIDLLSATGKMVHTVYDGYKEKGLHRLPVEVVNLPAGIYFCRMILGNEVAGMTRIIKTGE